jgi:hypothetical protein
MSKILIFDSQEHGRVGINPDHVVKVVSHGSTGCRLLLTRGSGVTYDFVNVIGKLERVVAQLNGGSDEEISGDA